MRRTFSIRDEDTIFESMRLYSSLSGEFSESVTEMTELFDFTIASLQWDKQIRKMLRDERRPANSYNLIRTIMNVIFSIEFQNRRKGIAQPRTGGDNKLSQMVTETLYYFLYHANFPRVHKKVFMDTIVARRGVWYVGWDYSQDPKGTLVLEACDPREFMFEPVYDDPLWNRAGFVMRKHSLSLEEIINQYALNDNEMQEAILQEAAVFFEREPGKRDKYISKKLKALFSAVYETATGYSNTDNNFQNYLQWFDPNTGKFDVLELHEKRTERRLMVPDRDKRKLIDITEPYQVLVEDKFDGIRFNDNEAITKIRETYGLQGEPRVEIENRRFVTATIPTFNLKVNEQPYPFESNYYTYIPQQCYDLHADPLKVQSVMDDLKDPQAHFNKAQSLKLELLGRYANKGWIMDENAISGLEDDWSSNRIAPYRRVRAGYINMIKPEEGQTISPDLIRDSVETQQLMQVISNAKEEIRGESGSEVSSGKHFIAKEAAQSKSFSYVLDNRDETQKAVLEMSLNFVQHFVKAERIIRITQDVKEPHELVLNQKQFYYDEQKQMIAQRISNDLDAVRYDIELSDEPYSASAQEIKYAKLSDAYNATLAVNPKKADLMLPIMLEAGNIPDYQKILRVWEEAEQPTEEQMQMQAMMQQLQQIMAKLGIEEKQAEVDGKREDVKSKKLKNLEAGQRINQNAKMNALGILPQQGKGNGKAPKEMQLN